MCYSAQIQADFQAYQRFGGTLDLNAYVNMAGWSKRNGTWIQSVPKGIRNALLPSNAGSLSGRALAHLPLRPMFGWLQGHSCGQCPKGVDGSLRACA